MKTRRSTRSTGLLSFTDAPTCSPSQSTCKPEDRRVGLHRVDLRFDHGCPLWGRRFSRWADNDLSCLSIDRHWFDFIARPLTFLPGSQSVGFVEVVNEPGHLHSDTIQSNRPPSSLIIDGKLKHSAVAPYFAWGSWLASYFSINKQLL